MTNSNNYGFIITRHVNSETTNKYWNQCVKLIRTFYPLKPIVIIDDNSYSQFIKADEEYSNITIIMSEFPGRGELLPYVYLLKYKWFPSAVIIHDSVFIHKRIPFEKLTVPALPLWHYHYDRENIQNILRINRALKKSHILHRKLADIPHPQTKLVNSFGIIPPINSNNDIYLCFGGQCYIQLQFLEKLEHKYNISNLTSAIHNRPDRCSFERILGALLCEECPKLRKIHSLFGNIMRHPHAFQYKYDDYTNDLNNRKKICPFIKVWTGR
jgi:hypothetical protein